MTKWWYLPFCALIANMGVSLAAIDAYEFDSIEQERSFHSLNKTLRCPKCQNNSIGDSNAELAKDLRQKVYEMLHEGQSEDEIVDYMVARYGNFVTYQPPLTAGTVILWGAPISVVLLGIGLLLYRRPSEKNSAQLSQQEQQRLQQLLDEDDKDRS
ncbi:cytochrome c-type biogenesis protein [Thaumasiovibrio sp. DFM-14]|uniref:cytochrome c-type biogenesis protein n=1 Tax=Thaumasiovibrio sp. DFM-14 TaxID=3384792 RepID=UPI00399FA6B9